MDIKRNIGKRIKSLRRYRELSQEKLSEKSEISSKYLSSIERGNENPSFDVFIKIAAALNVDLSDIFDYTVNVNSNRKALTKRELKTEAIRLIKDSDEETLKIILKVLRALT